MMALLSRSAGIVQKISRGSHRPYFSEKDVGDVDILEA